MAVFASKKYLIYWRGSNNSRPGQDFENKTRNGNEVA
jgi:hypothetical protein